MFLDVTKHFSRYLGRTAKNACEESGAFWNAGS